MKSYKAVTLRLLFCLTVVFATVMVQAQDQAMKPILNVVKKATSVVLQEPEAGSYNILQLDGSSIKGEGAASKIIPIPIDKAKLLYIRGDAGKFKLEIDSDLTGAIVLGCDDRPWLCASNGNVFVGDQTLAEAGIESPFAFVREQLSNELTVYLTMLQTFAGMGTLPITLKEDEMAMLKMVCDSFGLLETHAKIEEGACLFSAPESKKVEVVSTTDLCRQFSALINFVCDRLLPQIGDDGNFKHNGSENPQNALRTVAHASNGAGLLARQFRHNVLFMEGTPTAMGTAAGELLAPAIRRMLERVLFGVGTLTTLQTGTWFIGDLSDIERRTTPFIPARYFEEIDAMAVAVGASQRDARLSNLFPERFHCSGVAVRDTATKDGQVYHARVLDYMSDILLQEESCLQVFMPQGRNRWVSHGYGGLAGTVTAMNEKGLAMGEMGGRGEGDWDGLPMAFLMREVMELADNVEQALEVIRSNPLTCEYYYVLSDAEKNMVGIRCVPGEVLVLQPGEQHELLPFVPEDCVMFSAGGRADVLSERLQENFGNFDVPAMIELIKRPVAMSSNLHNAIFVPQAREIYISDAGNGTSIVPACDMPYHRFQLDELFDFYAKEKK